ncbi:archaellin/type IV pilin N-terminal domain-containing protein [Natrialba taiwanensis]|uniref:Flagellin domain-containing protein n=1 Tax=Natrialba taiwanensis DSM 12281 TaxID=1230458 RepID=L9ZS06_9EURY|nr:type IV pilin N-terminal domain-containing protein [Natrialba taiwanensis]ELY87928.1 flagellin domain-containing protein [Natrialba taiwanensis DSM 12281]
MDLTTYRAKLTGNAEERAVSPVIGVILMVAITVILAAVIAAFVLDMGDSMGEGPVNELAGTDVDTGEQRIVVSIENPQDASSFVVRGDNIDETTLDSNSAGESDTFYYNPDSSEQSEISNNANVHEISEEEGELTVVAQDGSAESQIATASWDFS